jgi:hypothetical protein
MLSRMNSRRAVAVALVAAQYSTTVLICKGFWQVSWRILLTAACDTIGGIAG